jgi:hypothetical protein
MQLQKPTPLLTCREHLTSDYGGTAMLAQLLL